MTTKDFIALMESGEVITAGSSAHKKMHELSQEAIRITMQINNAYHTHDEIVALMSELTGTEIHGSFGLFPPFYTEFGKNISIGKNVFINACCCFQDQGGISIGDGALIGHRVVLATINHGLAPDERQCNYPAPIVIGRNVWLGAGSIVLPGVTIGENAVVAAGAVVNRDVEPGAVVGGVPARFIKHVPSVGHQMV